MVVLGVWSGPHLPTYEALQTLVSLLLAFRFDTNLMR